MHSVIVSRLTNAWSHTGFGCHYTCILTIRDSSIRVYIEGYIMLKAIKQRGKGAHETFL